MHYHDIPHQSPEVGKELPAFIVAEYDKGDLLLYSHGSFDIWCVYHATRLNEGSEYQTTKNVYPLELDAITVRRTTGTETDFTGNIVEYALIDFDFDAPEDADYMLYIRKLASKYDKDKVWTSFMELYESIPQKIDIEITKDMTKKVLEIVAQYPEEPGLRQTLDYLLCTMIAENNRLKKYGSKYDTKLGKKLKALGVYQSIYETNMSIREIVNYSKNKSWKQLSKECKNRGIDTPDML